MKHWSFVSGLTLLLLLMLALSGYCIWVTRGLTGELDRLITLNYEKIRAMRDLRSSMIRINCARTLAGTKVDRAFWWFAVDIRRRNSLSEVRAMIKSQNVDGSRLSVRKPLTPCSTTSDIPPTGRDSTGMP